MDLTRRELVGRYRGSVLGIFWSFLHPFFLLAVYTTVFGGILGIQLPESAWTGSSQSIADFAIYLFSGMITWNLMAEAVQDACGLIYGRPAFVKKVVFPLEILAVVKVCTAIVHFLFAGTILLISIFFFAELQWTTVFFPLVLIPLALFTLGVTWFLSALGVYLRDLGESVGVLLMAGMFLTPIFYAMQDMPPAFRLVLQLNPLTWFIIAMRGLVSYGELPGLGELGLAWLASFLVAWLGYAFFQRTRPGFGDVL